MFFLVRGQYSETSFLSFESWHFLFRVCRVEGVVAVVVRALGEGGVTGMERFGETETPGKVKQALVYVQLLGNL